jgi:hypothetical protein
MQVFHFSFSVNGAVPPKAAATALAAGADAVGTRRELPLPPFNLEVALADAPWIKARTATLISGTAGHPDGSDAGHPDAGHPWNKAGTAAAGHWDAGHPWNKAGTAAAGHPDGADAGHPWNKAGTAAAGHWDAGHPWNKAGTAAAGHWDAGHPWNKAGTAAAGHSDGADVATAKMFADISGRHAKVSEDATEDCRSERTLCEDLVQQAARAALAAEAAAAEVATLRQILQKAPALRPPKQVARPPRLVKVRPRAKKAAALHKAHPPRHPKKAGCGHDESSSSPL